jgi:hypothetical protein
MSRRASSVRRSQCRPHALVGAAGIVDARDILLAAQGLCHDLGGAHIVVAAEDDLGKAESRILAAGKLIGKSANAFLVDLVCPAMADGKHASFRTAQHLRHVKTGRATRGIVVDADENALRARVGDDLNDLDAGLPCHPQAVRDLRMIDCDDDQALPADIRIQDVGGEFLRIAFVDEGAVDGNRMVERGRDPLEGAIEPAEKRRFRPHHHHLDADRATINIGDQALVAKTLRSKHDLLRRRRPDIAPLVENPLDSCQADACLLRDVCQACPLHCNSS